MQVICVMYTMCAVHSCVTSLSRHTVYVFVPSPLLLSLKHNLTRLPSAQNIYGNKEAVALSGVQHLV